MNIKYILITALLSSLLSPAHAVVVTWTGSGSIASVASNLDGIVNQGDLVYISASYESSAPVDSRHNVNPSDETFYGPGANVSLRFTIGSLVWEGVQNVSPTIRTAVVQNNIFGQSDNLILVLQDDFYGLDTAVITGVGVNKLFLNFHSSDMNLFSGISLPDVDGIHLESLRSFSGQITYNNATTVFTGKPLTVAVPEPSAVSLLAIGLSGWAMFRRRRS